MKDHISVASSEEIQPIGTPMGNETVLYQDEGELLLFDSEKINLMGISTTGITMNCCWNYPTVHFLQFLFLNFMSPLVVLLFSTVNVLDAWSPSTSLRSSCGKGGIR